MKVADNLLRAVAVFVGSTAGGAGINENHPFIAAVGVALVGVSIYPPSTFKPKTPLWKLEQRSVELERETGLVFDNFGTSCKLWPGYWEFRGLHSIGGTLSGGHVSKSIVGQRVRPEGCVDNYWLDPEKYVGLEAVDYFENEVPKLLEQDKAQKAHIVQYSDVTTFVPEHAPLPPLPERQLEPASHCQHELMNNPAGDPGSTFCYKCGSTFPGAATPLPAAAAKRAASGEERRKINDELELLLKVLTSHKDLRKSEQKKLVERCRELDRQLDVGRPTSGGRVPYS